VAEHWVELGRLGRPKGLKGWQRLESWTDPEQGIFAYQPWNLRHPSGARHTVDEVEHQRHGEGWLVRLNGVQSRDEAAAHVGCWVEVRRAQLPTLPPGEHYRVDMLGLRVRNLQNIELGRVVRIEEMPAHPVMVVQAEGEHGVEERWLPYTREHVRQVDLESGWIEIDWPEDF
jgi:16S rRNA processing protein RimM